MLKLSPFENPNMKLHLKKFYGALLVKKKHYHFKQLFYYIDEYVCTVGWAKFNRFQTFSPKYL
jgi:hypothetical protein